MPSKSGRPPPSLHPQNIIRSIVFVQATVRRKLLARRLSKDELERVPLPAAHVAVSFCQNLLKKNALDVEAEALGVAALICGRDSKRPDLWKKVRGLDLACIAGAHDYYTPHLPAWHEEGESHPVLMMLQERFREVAADVEDDIMERLQTATLPSVARAKMQAALDTWGCPDKIPGAKVEEEAFPHAKAYIARLKDAAENVISAQLSTATTKASLTSLRDAVEREMGGQQTVMRQRVRDALNRHREHAEMAAMNHFGWPPKGPVPKLSHAARWYGRELGLDCAIVEDFAATVVRERRRIEAKAAAELGPLELEIKHLRKLVEADPPPPKLMADGWQEQLKDTFAKAETSLKRWGYELGQESEVLQKHRQGIYGVDFPGICAKEATGLANTLRSLGPWRDPEDILDEPVESSDAGEERLDAAAKLFKLLPWLRSTGSADQADAIAKEFQGTLKHLEPYMKLTDPDDFEDDDDGWHKPPGLENVDVPYVPPPKTPPKPKSPPRPPTPPDADKKFKARIRLHGVTTEDMRCHSELLLLEQCAGIIAKECGIPQEWITGIDLVAKEVEEPQPPAVPEEETGTLYQL
eukprot:TRINITY_DN17241_c0_g1_i2.p1 TRINITY_DN17241_c0_g1~~TRINITY_DN17241_c0_g1_i2.p1  ORF type:complete len:582 (-),score=157.93 TRINITY_DN17241_c0_g1_i2:280-2025(-)